MKAVLFHYNKFYGIFGTQAAYIFRACRLSINDQIHIFADPFLDGFAMFGADI